MGRVSKDGLRRWAWYAGVLLAIPLTVMAFLSRSLLLTVELVILVWVLGRYSGIARLSDVYREKGISDDFLRGRRDETPTD